MAHRAIDYRAHVEKIVKMDAGKGLSNKNQAFGIQSLLCFVVLSLAWLVGFASRLFAIIRFESIIHEFDPW